MSRYVPRPRLVTLVAVAARAVALAGVTFGVGLAGSFVAPLLAQIDNYVPIAGGGGGGTVAAGTVTTNDGGVGNGLAVYANASTISPISVTYPTALAGNTNDWAVTPGIVFFSATSTFNVTGIVAATGPGQVIWLCNTGSNAVTFTHQDALSVAANRLVNGLGNASGNEVAAGGQCVGYGYDVTNARWRLFFTTSPSGLLPIAGGTMTGLITLGTAGITAGSAADVNIVTNTTGNVVLAGGTTGYVQVNSSQANYQLWVAAQATSAGVRIYPDNTANSAGVYFDQDISHHKMFIGWSGSGADADYASNNNWYAYAGAPNHQLVSGDVGVAGTSLLTVKANVDATGATVMTVDGVGNLVLASTASRTKGTCTLNGGTPSTCTATVTAGSICTCSEVGASAAIAATGCAVGLSSTTLTITGAAAASNNVNYLCF